MNLNINLLDMALNISKYTYTLFRNWHKYSIKSGNKHIERIYCENYVRTILEGEGEMIVNFVLGVEKSDFKKM